MIKKGIPVSIIMPTFDIDKAEPSLRNLLKQKYSNKDIIIINDNPKLKIPSSILKIIKTHKIRLMNNPKNMGIAESVNKGIKAAKTNIILIFCSDYFCKDKYLIRDMVNKLYSEENIGCVGHSVIVPIKIWRSYDFLTKLFTFRHDIKTKPPGDLAMFKKEVFNRVGLFDSKNFIWGGEDGDMQKRVKKAGYKTNYVENSVIHLHYDKNSTFLKIIKREYHLGGGHGARKRKEGILKRVGKKYGLFPKIGSLDLDDISVGLFDFDVRILLIIGFIIGLFVNPLISLFCFLPFFFAALIQSIKAYPQTKWIPGLILYPFVGIFIFLVQTVGAIKGYFKSKPDKYNKNIEYLKK